MKDWSQLLQPFPEGWVTRVQGDTKAVSHSDFVLFLFLFILFLHDQILSISLFCSFKLLVNKFLWILLLNKLCSEGTGPSILVWNRPLLEEGLDCKQWL